MRASIVPSQITTVEDKIIGSLSVKQAILIIFPVLIGFLAMLLSPPFGRLVFYKVEPISNLLS